MYINVTTPNSMQTFREDVSIQIWNNNLTDVNEQFNDFYWRLEGCVNRPMKKISRRELKLDSKPWITPKIVRLIKYRNTLYLILSQERQQ